MASNLKFSLVWATIVETLSTSLTIVWWDMELWSMAVRPMICSVDRLQSLCEQSDLRRVDVVSAIAWSPR